MLGTPCVPALWTVLPEGQLVPLCEHPHAPHIVASAASSPRCPPRLSTREVAHLRRCHSLATTTLDEQPLRAMHAEGVRDHALRDAVARYWQGLGPDKAPLQAVVDQEDSSQRRWLCPEHASELAFPDSGNVFRDASHDGAVVAAAPVPVAPAEASFLRWLRLGVALKQAHDCVAKALQPRVEQWYRTTLSAAVPKYLAREHRRSVLPGVVLASAAAAVKSELEEAKVDVDVDMDQADLAAKPCTDERHWKALLRDSYDASADTVAVNVFMLRDAANDARFVVKLGSLHKAVRAAVVGQAVDIDALLDKVEQQFVANLATFGKAASLELRAMAVNSNVLLAVESAPPSLACDGSEAACSRPAAAGGKVDPTQASSGVCVTCRAWAQAIKANHRHGRRMPRSDSWRNCVPHVWSSESVRGSSEAVCLCWAVLTLPPSCVCGAGGHIAAGLGGSQGLHGWWQSQRDSHYRGRLCVSGERD